MTIPKGLNMETKTGPVWCKHQVIIPTWNAEPMTPCQCLQMKFRLLGKDNAVIITGNLIYFDYRV